MQTTLFTEKEAGVLIPDFDELHNNNSSKSHQTETSLVNDFEEKK